MNEFELIQDINLQTRVNVKDFGAIGDGITNDTIAIQNALNTKNAIYIPEGNYLITDTLFINPFQYVYLNKKAILKFTNNSLLICIKLTMSSTLEGGFIEVDENYKNKVISYASDYNYDVHDESFPYTYGRSDVMTIFRATIKNTTIQKNQVRPKTLSVIGGSAIDLEANDNTIYNFLWGITIDNVNINGGFGYAISMKTLEINNGNPWLHDTLINNVFVHYAETCFYFNNIRNVFINGGAYQPQSTLDNNKFAKHGLELQSSSNIKLHNFIMWDWDQCDSTYMNQLYYLIGECSHVEIYDFATVIASSEKRLYYDTLKTVLTLEYYTAQGRFYFPEALNYKDYQEQTAEAKKNVVSYYNEHSFFDYSIPVYPPINTSGTSPSSPIYVQIGYVDVPRNSSGLYQFSILEQSNNGVVGYSTISFTTDVNGNPAVSRILTRLENSKITGATKYSYTSTVDATTTRIYVYKKYTSYLQDVHWYFRSIKIISSFKFITNIAVNVIPTSPVDVNETLTNPYSSRPTNVPIGFTYWDSNISKPIWWQGSTWRDATGTIV